MITKILFCVHKHFVNGVWHFPYRMYVLLAELATLLLSIWQCRLYIRIIVFILFGLILLGSLDRYLKGNLSFHQSSPNFEAIASIATFTWKIWRPRLGRINRPNSLTEDCLKNPTMWVAFLCLYFYKIGVCNQWCLNLRAYILL